MLKTYLISALVGLGIAGAIFAFQVGKITQTADSDPKQPLENAATSNKPLVEALTLKTKISSNAPSENLTELITKEIGKTILLNNPNGPVDINGDKGLAAPDPDAIAQQVIEEAVKKFDPSSLRPTIKISDLKIIQDNSKEAIAAYILDFQKINKYAANKIPKSFFSQELTLESIIELSNIYSETIDAFYKLPTPSSVLSIHKKQIELLETKNNVFDKLKNYQNDPVTAILAAQELEKVDFEFLELSREFSRLIKKPQI